MIGCPNCGKQLVEKPEEKKICAQIGNPDIAIVKVSNSKFCDRCNEYFLNTDGVSSAIKQINSMSGDKKEIEVGIYS